jgi:hypothetical protein
MPLDKPLLNDFRQRRERLHLDLASAMMEWRALDAEEQVAIRTGDNFRAGRLAGMKAQLVARLPGEAMPEPTRR